MVGISYAGQHVVITGAHSGIGAALLGLVKAAGAERITVLDLNPPGVSEAAYIRTDMGNPDSVDAAAAAIEGDIDVLFNNAGIAGDRRARDVIRVNWLGLHRLTERLLPRICEGGAVINTASIAGNQWRKNVVALRQLIEIDDWGQALKWIDDNSELVADGYFFSKEAVQVYTMLLSRRAASRGIRVNSVCPSPVDTPLLPAFRETLSDATIDWTIAEGLGRVALPEDMARVMLFLGSGLASYINGVNLMVDGGFSANLSMRPG